MEWTEGHGFTLRLHRGKDRAFPVFNQLFFHYAIEETDDKTLFCPSILYEPRFGVVGQLLSIFFIRRSFEKTLKVICQSMKEFYETNKPVSPKRIEEIKRLVANV